MYLFLCCLLNFKDNSISNYYIQYFDYPVNHIKPNEILEKKKRENYTFEFCFCNFNFKLLKIK